MSKLHTSMETCPGCGTEFATAEHAKANQIIAEQRKELAALREGVEKNAEIYCEGWCKESGGRGCFEDCSGCQIYAPLLEVKDE